MDKENDQELDPELELEVEMKVHRILRYEKEYEQALFEIQVFSLYEKIFDFSIFYILFTNHFYEKIAILGFVFDIIDLLGSFFNKTLNTLMREETFTTIFLLFFVIPILFSIIVYTIVTVCDTIGFYFTAKKKFKIAVQTAMGLAARIKMERSSVDDLMDIVKMKEKQRKTPPS